MKIHLFCKCGGEAKGEIKPDVAADKFTKLFWAVHSKPDCGECGPHQCHGARKDWEDDK